MPKKKEKKLYNYFVKNSMELPEYYYAKLPFKKEERAKLDYIAQKRGTDRKATIYWCVDTMYRAVKRKHEGIQ